MAALTDDPDVHAMSGDAFKLWVILKLTLRAAGIGMVYPSKLCDQVNCEKARLEELFRELETPKPGRTEGWIMRDRNLVWLINGLKWEVLTPATNSKHVSHVRGIVAQLDQHSPVVSAFKRRYAEWFEASDSQSGASGKAIDSRSEGATKGPDAESQPSTEGNDSHRNHKTRQDLTKQKAEKTPLDRDLDLERATAENRLRRGAAVSAPPASAPDEAAEGKPPAKSDVIALYAALPPLAKRFVGIFYPKGHATPQRREDVMRQLSRTLTGGTPIRKGEIVFALSPERLERKCREVMSDRVRDPDKAICVLLMKLADTSDVSPEKVRVAKQERRTEERQTAAELATAEAWIGEHPDVEISIAGVLEKQGLSRGDASSPDGRLQATCWNVSRTFMVLAEWRRRAQEGNWNGGGTRETAVQTAAGAGQ